MFIEGIEVKNVTYIQCCLDHLDVYTQMYSIQSTTRSRKWTDCLIGWLVSWLITLGVRLLAVSR